MGLLAATAISAYDGEPTDDELAGWWESLTSEQRLAELRKLDRVEHEVPDVQAPAYATIVTRDEVILLPAAPLRLAVGHLAWDITLPEQRAAFDPRPNTAWIWSGIAGLLVGGSVTLWLTTMVGR